MFFRYFTVFFSIIFRMTITLEIHNKALLEKDEIIAKYENVIVSLEGQILRMQGQLEALIRQMYGRKSEKLDPNQLLMETLILSADGAAMASVPEVPVSAPQGEPVARRKGHGRRPLPDHLPRHEIIIPVPEEEKTCPVTGTERPFLGYEESQKLEYIPETLRINVYKREKYGSPMGAEENGVITAPLPQTVLNRCLADTGLLAHVAVSKFDDHLPLFRQQKMLSRQGVDIQRTTMAGWLNGLGEALSGLDRLISRHILDCGVVHHDDTPVKMLDPGAGKTKETRLWVAVSGNGPPLVHFAFSLNRRQEHPIDYFRGYSGALMCDEYAGYANVDCSKLLSCWAHARRYIEKAKTVEPAFATELLWEIAELYKIEDRIKDLDEPARLRIRQDKSVAQIESIFKILESREFRPQSPMQKAKQYALNNRKALTIYTTDSRFPIDNNPAERAIRRVAIGRKNWLFLGSETGGETAATLMSLLGTCWANNINSWTYLKSVLDLLPATPEKDLAQLLPHRWIETHPEARLPKIK